MSTYFHLLVKLQLQQNAEHKHRCASSRPVIVQFLWIPYLLCCVSRRQP